MPRTTEPTLSPAYAAWNTVARFDDYQDGQHAVDWLSDEGFPVETLDVVGSDLRLVERVTGRRTNARAAVAGAVSGLWVGLLIARDGTVDRARFLLSEAGLLSSAGLAAEDTATTS